MFIFGAFALLGLAGAYMKLNQPIEPPKPAPITQSLIQ